MTVMGAVGKYAGAGLMAAGAGIVGAGAASSMPGNPVAAVDPSGGVAMAAGGTMIAVGAGIEMVGGLFARAFLRRKREEGL